MTWWQHGFAVWFLANMATFASFAARADQIDYLITCTTEAACQADPVIGDYYILPSTNPDGSTNPGSWRGDVVFAPIQIWQPSQDTTSTITNPDGNTFMVVTHTFLPGFSLIISLVGRLPALDADANTQLVADRDLAAAGQSFVLQSLFTDAQLGDYMLQPTPQGSRYPFGAPPP